MVPQNGWFIMAKPIKIDDLGVPLFLETPISPMRRMPCSSQLPNFGDVLFFFWVKLLGESKLGVVSTFFFGEEVYYILFSHEIYIFFRVSKNLFPPHGNSTLRIVGRCCCVWFVSKNQPRKTFGLVGFLFPVNITNNPRMRVSTLGSNPWYLGSMDYNYPYISRLDTSPK